MKNVFDLFHATMVNLSLKGIQKMYPLYPAKKLVQGREESNLQEILNTQAERSRLLLKNYSLYAEYQQIEMLVSEFKSNLGIEIESAQLSEILHCFPYARMMLSMYGPLDSETFSTVLNVLYIFLFGCMYDAEEKRLLQLIPKQLNAIFDSKLKKNKDE